MGLQVRYYALVGSERSTTNPYNVIREVRDERGYTLARLDMKNPSFWVDDPDLAGYVFMGEGGAEPITEAQAREIVERKGGIFSPPKIES